MGTMSIKREIPFNEEILAIRVVQALENIGKSKIVSEEDKFTLNDGKYLIAKILEGSALVQNDKTKQHSFSVEEGLFTYGYALNAARSTEAKDKDIDTLFNKLSNNFNSIINGIIEAPKINELKSFFMILEDVLSKEISRESFKQAI